MCVCMYERMKNYKFDVRRNSQSEGKGNPLRVENRREARCFVVPRTLMVEKTALKLSPAGRG